jgi:hypothetical protein
VAAVMRSLRSDEPLAPEGAIWHNLRGDEARKTTRDNKQRGARGQRAGRKERGRRKQRGGRDEGL